MVQTLNLEIQMKKALNFNFARQPLFWVSAVMRRFSIWYQKITCKHTVLTFERIDYQDRYVKCKCDKCGEDVYKDI